MRTHLWATAVIVLLWGCNRLPAQDSVGSAPAYLPVHNFDPKRNASADIQAAIQEAQRTGKRIILDVGGDWCQYCHQMDRFFLEQPAIRELRDKNFVIVDIYYGHDNKNRDALSQFSKVLGVPHFFVLDSKGSLLHSQHMLELRLGGSYDPPKMKAFFLKWSPPPGELKAEIR